MSKNYQKGETLIIEFQEGEKRINAVGVVLGSTGKKLFLGHNFSGTDSIDTTSINMENILSEEVIDPDEMKEIKNLSDLK